MGAISKFTITWSGHQNGHWNIYAQSYLANGAANGSNFQVNTSTNQDQEYSSIAFAGSANPIITWSSNSQDGSGWGVYAQQVTPTGTLLGSEVQVNTYTQDNQFYSSVAGAASGDVAIVWTSNNQDGSSYGVYGQNFTTGASILPVANNDAFNTNVNTPLNVAAPGVLGNDTGPPALPLNAILVSSPAHGSLTLNPDGSFTYTPNANYYGGDGFKYQANDTLATSNVATVSLTIDSLPPVAVNDSYSTPVNTQLNVGSGGVLVNDTDPQGRALSAFLVSGPIHGVVALAGDGTVRYTPNTNYTGPDSFTYQANDGLASSNVATVNLMVTGLAGYTVAPTSLQTSKAGASASFSVVLNTQPTSPVTINLSSTNPAEGSLSASALTFNAANWNVAQLVTVTGLNDGMANGNQIYQINGTASSADASYNGLTTTPVTVTNIDTNTAGFVVSPTGLTTSESGTSATFTIALTTLPLLPVTLNLTNGNPAQGTLSQNSLTFTLLNWNGPQTITVTGLDDHTVNGNQTYQINGTASSLDLFYNGVAITPVTVVNQEADVAGFTATPGAVTTSETGTSASFTVNLTSRPIAPVTINLSTSVAGQGSLSASVLTFDASNWNLAQNVTVTGLDDSIVNGDQTYQVNGTASSSDAIYNGVVMTPVTVVNKEADTAGIVVSPASLTTSETGTSASFTVNLTSKPIAPVTINL
jgi:hypothetical protein